VPARLRRMATFPTTRGMLSNAPTMNFGLSEDHLVLRQSARTFIEGDLAPARAGAWHHSLPDLLPVSHVGWLSLLLL